MQRGAAAAALGKEQSLYAPNFPQREHWRHTRNRKFPARQLPPCTNRRDTPPAAPIDRTCQSKESQKGSIGETSHNHKHAANTNPASHPPQASHPLGQPSPRPAIPILRVGGRGCSRVGAQGGCLGDRTGRVGRFRFVLPDPAPEWGNFGGYTYGCFPTAADGRANRCVLSSIRACGRGRCTPVAGEVLHAPIRARVVVRRAIPSPIGVCVPVGVVFRVPCCFPVPSSAPTAAAG